MVKETFRGRGPFARFPWAYLTEFDPGNDHGGGGAGSQICMGWGPANGSEEGEKAKQKVTPTSESGTKEPGRASIQIDIKIPNKIPKKYLH